MVTVGAFQAPRHMNMPTPIPGSCKATTSPNIRRYFSTNTTLTALCVFGSVTCFIPVVLGHFEFEQSVLHEALTSDKNRDLAVAVLSLVAPMFVEIVFEFINNFSVGAKSKKLRMHMRESLLNPFEQFLLMCGIMSVAIVAFLPADTHHLVSIYLCLGRFRILLVGGVVITSLYRYDKKIWTARISYSSLLLAITSCASGAYADNQGPHNTPSRKIADAALLFGIGLCMFCAFKWFYINIPPPCVFRTNIPCVFPIKCKIHDTDVMGSQSNAGPGKLAIMFPFLYILSVTMCGVYLAATVQSYPNVTFNVNWFFFSNLGCVVYLLFLLTISDRMTKYEIVQGLVRESYPYVLYCTVLFFFFFNLFSF